MFKYRKLKYYKYKTTEVYSVDTPIKPNDYIKNSNYVKLNPRGRLVISKGYAWDGASGPAIDTDTIMRASLIHDALYQLIRSGDLDKKYRHAVDELLRDICLEDGMHVFRATYVFWAVRLFGGFAVEKDSGE